MRSIAVIVVLFLSLPVLAQTADLKDISLSAAKLNTALLQKDSVALKTLLHDKLTYGHSNGWIESKEEVIRDLFSGKLVYNKITQTEPEIVLEGNTASLRATMDLDAALNGNRIQMKLAVLQVWVKKGKHWVLLSRQSGRI